MQHARGSTQAQHLSATRRSKDIDVHMGELAVYDKDAKSPLRWQLQEECSKCAQAGDWDGVGMLSGALVALVNDKSKGKGNNS